MDIHVIGGGLDSGTAVISVPGYNTLWSLDGTHGGIYSFQRQLLDRYSDRLSAVELKHKLEEANNGFTKSLHSSLYILIDKDDKELFIIQGMMKGNAGEGSRGAFTLDTYLDLFNIPTSRAVLSQENLNLWNGEKFIPVPDPRKPKFSLENLARMKEMAKNAHLEIDSGSAGLDKLYVGMPLEEALNAANFHHYGRYDVN